MIDPRIQFRALWETLGARGDVDEVFDELARRYSAPCRHYHTLAHVQHVLQRFGEIAPGCAVECHWAIWFHDAFEDVNGSAILASAEAMKAGLGRFFASRVASLVGATEHDGRADTWNARAVCDADLGILGASPDVFDRYESQVRQEFALVDEAEFRAGRGAILRQLLDRPGIFYTTAARIAWEVPARENLLRSIRRLDSAEPIDWEGS